MTKSLRMLFLVLALALTPVMAWGEDPYGDGNKSIVNQYGGDLDHPNQAYVDQDGKINLATINQGAPGEPVYDNVASQTQTNHNNTATITQHGVWNDATQIQKGHDSHATITQTGDGDGSLADINVAIQKQGLVHSTSYDNYAEIIQRGGHGNFASQIQDGEKDGYFALHPVKIEQVGSYNTAEQVQGPVSYNESATILQTGMGNTARQEQQCCNNTATIVQNLDGNYALQQQVFSNYSTADIYQSGSENWAEQYQHGSHLVARASQDTFGCLNQSFQNQVGIGHLSTVLQDGSANYVNVVQRGGSSVHP